MSDIAKIMVVVVVFVIIRGIQVLMYRKFSKPS